MLSNLSEWPLLAHMDAAPASQEHKLLQLRQYVCGEALAAIERPGFSSAAYQAALDLLNRKYGGKRRRVAFQLEEFDKIEVVRFSRPKDLEVSVDLLQKAIVN